MEYPTPEKYFKSTKFLLPIFLTSRKDDKEEDDDSGKVEEIHARPLKISRHKSTEKSWKLAPNRYNVTGEIGLRKKGMKGAYWSQLKRKPIGGKPLKGRIPTAFYEIPRDSEKFERRCLWHKGTFTTDPRRRRPSTRFMVSSAFTCWRDPKDPGPTKYFIGIFAQKKFPKSKESVKVPYKFLRYSCVPDKKIVAPKKKSSFDPAPGRYEIIDDEESLTIALNIEKQNRLKFRRQTCSRVNTGKHKKGVLRHIFGYGFKRLFRGPPLRPAVVVSKKKARKVDHEVKLFHSFEYIRMITQPERVPLSLRTEKLVRRVKPIRYNCVVRVIIRRQLRNNRKIAFNSGTPRFPEDMTTTSKKTPKPPPLVDHPVMRVHPNEIESKLHALPQRLMGICKENRIRPFKFQPLPIVKLLLDETDVYPKSIETAEIHPRELKPIDFFKEEFKKH